MNTHPLHGVHGRPNRYSDRAGTVVHVTEGTSEAPAFLYLLLDEPRPDGTMILIIRSTDFVPTDPAALRASLAPRNYAAEAAAMGRAMVYAALGDSPPTKLADFADRIGKAVRP